MESVRGTFVAKEGQREEGSVGALRRKEAGSEIGGGKDGKKAEEGSAGKDRIGRARTGGEEVKEEREMWKKGKVDLEGLERKSKGRKDGEEGGAVKKAVVAKRKEGEGRKVKEEGDRMSWWEMSVKEERERWKKVRRKKEENKDTKEERRKRWFEKREERIRREKKTGRGRERKEDRREEEKEGEKCDLEREWKVKTRKRGSGWWKRF